MKIRKIQPRAEILHKRVAAYARVSTLKDEQADSFDTQVKYYEQVIKNRSHWEFCKVYSDHGFSGVSAEKRPGFMEMMADAREQKFDILLVRSISRFARNVAEAQKYCRELKILGIEVRFEREQISSTDTSTELVFNLLAAAAQEESHSVSEKMKWSIHQRQAQGVFHLGSGHVLGYDEVNGVLQPNERADFVRRIFEEFADGMTVGAICDRINEEGYCGLYGAKKISHSQIYVILQNEIYVGDRHLQKNPPKNYMTHRPDKTQDYHSYYIRDSHEGIVSRELWDSVQERLTQYRNARQNGIKRKKNSHFLFGFLYCGKCGSLMKRRSGQKPAWVCMDRVKHKKGCGCKNTIVPELEVLAQLCDLYQVTDAELPKLIRGKITLNDGVITLEG